MDRPAVDVTGMGLLCSLGNSVDEVFARMCRGECGMRPIDRFPVQDYPQKNAGQLSPDTEAELRRQFADEDLAAAMVKTAGAEALNQAGLGRAGAPDPRRGLVLATNFGPMETLEWCWRERLDVGTLDRDTFARFSGFVAVIAAALGCGGPRTQISLSCASGAGAVALASDWIRTGRAERVLAIGYDLLTEFCWCGLTNLRTITTDAVRPFDVRRSGTIFSEGAGAMLLEAETSRRARGAQALVRVAGVATGNNAFHMTAPAKEGEGSRRGMAAALQDAGLSPAALDHVCAHATATTANDPTEVAALRRLLGSDLERVTVSGHKSQLGHLMGAAGIAEAIVTATVIRRGIIPPTINHDQPDPECRVDCVPGAARQKPVRCAITNSAGIGGTNAALVLQARAD